MKQLYANGHAMPKESDGVTKLHSDKLFQDDQNLPNCTPVEFRKSGRITQSTSDQECTANVPLVYGECTGGVLKRYCKGTTEVLRRYYRGTKDIPTACTSPVHPDRRGGEVLVRLETHGHASVRNQDVPQNIIGDIRRGEISFAHSMSAKYFLPLHILLIFICCLFNNAFAQSQGKPGAVDGVEEIRPQNGERVINISYKYLFNKNANDYNKANHPNVELEKYPLIMYDLDYSQTPNVKIGDKLPAFFNTIAFQFVDAQGKTQTGTIADFSKDNLLVLDFWAPWCSPCVASMDKWNSFIKADNSSPVKVLGVMLDHDFKAQYYGMEREWSSPIIFGPEAYIMNSFFFDRQVVSRSVWIKEGRLIAITGTKGYDHEMVRDIALGIPVEVSMAYEWTYSSGRE